MEYSDTIKQLSINKVNRAINMSRLINGGAPPPDSVRAAARPRPARGGNTCAARLAGHSADTRALSDVQTACNYRSDALNESINFSCMFSVRLFKHK